MTVGISPSAQTANLQLLFETQKKNLQNVASTTVRQRKQKLKKLLKAMFTYQEDIRAALYKDYKKHPSEVDLTEIYPVTNEIKHAIKHIRGWMADESVKTPLPLLGSKSWIKYEPKGNVLVIAPWNFPVNLSFAPIISAIAAGNCIILKPSEHTPHASAVIKKIINHVFDENEVAVVEGGIETSQALLSLPFNHIFFTGAPSIGKIVMKAAAKHLASVTLELGGKSPTIVDETANINAAATRIAWSKFMNNGQICIAPDYLFVHKKVKDKFIKAVQKKIKQFYGESVEHSKDYARMVNTRHFDRVKSYLDDAISKGAKVIEGGQTNSESDFIAPTILTNVPANSMVMEEEIFGPLLPIHEYENIDEALKIINSKEKPLTIYIFSSRKKNINHILNNTRSGGTCINHTTLHFFNNNLPFGGSNNSGIGKGHGEYGFKEYSNARAVFKQVLPFSMIELLMPPYTSIKDKLIYLTMKYF